MHQHSRRVIENKQEKNASLFTKQLSPSRIPYTGDTLSLTNDGMHALTTTDDIQDSHIIHVLLRQMTSKIRALIFMTAGRELALFSLPPDQSVIKNTRFNEHVSSHRRKPRAPKLSSSRDTLFENQRSTKTECFWRDFPP